MGFGNPGPARYGNTVPGSQTPFQTRSLDLVQTDLLIVFGFYLTGGERDDPGLVGLTVQAIGRLLGIIGMGRIGQAIARRGAHGFGMQVLYHNRTRLPPALEAECKARHVGKDVLLANADHVVLVLPYTPDNHHTIGAQELARMKPTATLVNIARGGIVDEAALAAALREGRLAAAGLDVFEGEPAVHPDLLTLPNVVLTPHIASATVATRRAMANLAADNLIAFFDGRGPLTPVNQLPGADEFLYQNGL